MTGAFSSERIVGVKRTIKHPPLVSHLQKAEKPKCTPSYLGVSNIQHGPPRVFDQHKYGRYNKHVYLLTAEHQTIGTPLSATSLMKTQEPLSRPAMPETCSFYTHIKKKVDKEANSFVLNIQ